MAGGMEWFRWYHGSVMNPKFQLVARKAGAPLASVIAVWAYLLERASAAADRGAFGSIDLEAVDCMFGFEDGKTTSILMQMEARALIGDGRVLSWHERQPKREREGDLSTERVRAHRAMKRHETPTEAEPVRETPGATGMAAETPRGEENREEENRERRGEEIDTGAVARKGALGALTPALTPASAAGAAAKRGTRLSPDWVLPRAWGLWAREKYPHWDDETVRAVAGKFRNHWISKSGKDATKLDWYATWQNWCDSGITQGEHPPPKSMRGAVARGDSAAKAERIRAAIESTGGALAPAAAVLEGGHA